MNDEIREILVLQNYVNRYKSDEKAIINHSRLTTPLMLDYLEVKNLLDYITNLEQEKENYKSRVEKAVEYYKRHQQECVIGRNRDDKLIKDYYLPAQHSNVLLNILDGGSDDNG